MKIKMTRGNFGRSFYATISYTVDEEWDLKHVYHEVKYRYLRCRWLVIVYPYAQGGHGLVTPAYGLCGSGAKRTFVCWME